MRIEEALNELECEDVNLNSIRSCAEFMVKLCILTDYQDFKLIHDAVIVECDLEASFLVNPKYYRGYVEQIQFNMANHVANEYPWCFGIGEKPEPMEDVDAFQRGQ